MKIFTSRNLAAFTAIVLCTTTGFTANLTLQGEGTATNPYKVSSPADWKTLASHMSDNSDNLAGVYLDLTADIDLSGTEFTPLGEFNGIFDGLGHSISGISYATTASRQGVFTTIGTDATVKNLTLKGNITSSYAYTGGFAGTLNGRIENCTNLLNITTTQSYTAGFAAKATAGATFSECVNKGEITSKLSYIAGIAADGDAGVTYVNCGNEGIIHNNGASDYTAGITAVSLPATFMGCYNKGEIIIDSTTGTSCVAGILAWANNIAKATTNLFTFTDCYNTEYINAAGKVAGILGDITLTTSISVVLNMSGCYNSGTIIASGSPNGNIGTAGISCFYSPGSTFTDCYNTGIIQAEKKPYCAGVVGHFKQIVSNSPEKTTFDRCYNTGAIKVTMGQGSGILAYCHKNVTIKNCYNTGAITGKSTLGGILSTMASGSEIHNCWNTGDVTTEAETAAGIVANNANHCLISGCLNTGAITSKSSKTAGGIAASTGSDLIDCINFGHVKGLAQVGGLVGSPRKDNTTFTRCYNAGTVEAPDGVGGGIIGVSTESATDWSESNTLTDCYYVTGFNDFTIPQAGTPITIAELTKTDLGDSWMHSADNCMPILKIYAENEAAIVNSAAIVPSSGESFNNLSGSFALGIPQGVTWTSSSPVVSIDGSLATVSSIDSPVDVTLTASAGNSSRVWHVTVVPVSFSGISDSAVSDQAMIVKRIYFDATGKTIKTPAPHDGRVYIVREIDSNGNIATRKYLNN